MNLYTLSLFTVSFLSSVLFCESAQDFALVSIAKSGTGLVHKCIYKLTDKKRGYVPTIRDYKELNKKLFVGTHFAHTKVLNKVLSSQKIKKVVVNIRDPRDVLVSAARYYPDFRVMDPSSATDWRSVHPFKNKNLKKIVRGYLEAGLKGRLMPTAIYDVKVASEFIKNSNTDFLVVRYEDLVGSKGKGGNDQSQLEEVTKIAHFLDVGIQDKDLKEIGETIFGGTSTFRKGGSGGWKDYFDDDMKRMCKDLIGKELIELGYEEDYNW